MELTLNKEQIKALDALILYTCKDESKDYGTRIDCREDVSKHIFNDIHTLMRAIDDNFELAEIDAMRKETKAITKEQMMLHILNFAHSYVIDGGVEIYDLIEHYDDVSEETFEDARWNVGLLIAKLIGELEKSDE